MIDPVIPLITPPNVVEAVAVPNVKLSPPSVTLLLATPLFKRTL